MNRFLATLVLASLPIAAAQALPEDAEQPIDVYAPGDFEYDLEQGLVVYYGKEGEPACATQGTMQICGAEIRTELKDKEVRKITSIGKPATFQQQLEADDEEPMHASGEIMVFDNVGQMLTIDGDGQVRQAGIVSNAPHFEYDLETKRFRGTQSRTIIPPNPRQ